MLTPHEAYVIEALAGLALFLCGRYLWPSVRGLADRLDRAWAGGWDERDTSARELEAEYQATIERLQEDRHVLDSDRVLPGVRQAVEAAQGPDLDETRDMPWRWARGQARRAQSTGAGPRTSEPTAAELELARQQHGHVPIEGPLSPAQERAAHALDLPGPRVHALSGEQVRRAGELHQDMRSLILAGLTPLERLKVDGWDRDRRQEERLAAWEDACRASWDLASVA
jgi:hypothetical protein